jgi:peroxiredoxin
MATLKAGTVAPPVSLPAMEGSSFSLQQALDRGPVLLVFFKISCPVCQFTLPYLERIFRAGERRVNVVAVSQNTRQDTAFFLREYGISFPVLLDDPMSYPVSNAYGIDHVPSLFLISPGGEIELDVVGWSRADMESIHRRLSEFSGARMLPLFRPGEDVPAFKAG